MRADRQTDIFIVIIIIIIIIVYYARKQHRTSKHMHCRDAAYCYRRHTQHGLYVCWSRVCCAKTTTDRDAVWWAQRTMHSIRVEVPPGERQLRRLPGRWKSLGFCCGVRSKRINPERWPVWQRHCCSRLQCFRLVGVTVTLHCLRWKIRRLQCGLLWKFSDHLMKCSD